MSVKVLHHDGNGYFTCDAKSPVLPSGDYFHCTREKGHPGNCEAAANDGENQDYVYLAVSWANEGAEPEDAVKDRSVSSPAIKDWQKQQIESNASRARADKARVLRTKFYPNGS